MHFFPVKLNHTKINGRKKIYKLFPSKYSFMKCVITIWSGIWNKQGIDNNTLFPSKWIMPIMSRELIYSCQSSSQSRHLK